MGYRNEYEFRVFGPKRCGNHAIINWIATLFPEPVYFFNNCGYGLDPYVTGRTRGTRANTPIEHVFVRVPRMKKWQAEDIAPIREKPKKCIIYSYENVYIPKISRKPVTKDIENTIGPSRHVFDVVILRDVLNWAASAFATGGRTPYEGYRGWYEWPREFDWKNWRSRRKLLKIWKSHAQEFLWPTRHLRSPKVCISYNAWLKESYRERVAKLLGLVNNETSINVVAGVGNRGSKFDNFDFNGKARKMRVLERWKHFEDNESFFEIFDEESLSMSRAIFGRVGRFPW